MKILVTGGAGYVGSITVKHLVDAGHSVTVFDSMELGHKEAVDWRADLLVGDLRSREDIRAAMRGVKPDVVMHFAAYALVGESAADPGKYFHNNVSGGINLADAMNECGVKRIVFSSSCAVYGRPDKMPITEEMPQKPSNPYGQSKLIYEQILEWYRKIHDFRPCFLRYFNACGAEGRLGEDHTPETHIIPNVLKAALGKTDCVEIFGVDHATPDGTCIRDYVHVSDLARAHAAALTSDFCGAINLGTGRGFSVMEIVEAARNVTGKAIPVRNAPRRPGDPDVLVANPAKAKRVLNWEAEYKDPESIIRTAWEWHVDHPDGYAGTAQNNFQRPDAGSC